jgi:hypothetical protein
LASYILAQRGDASFAGAGLVSGVDTYNIGVCGIKWTRLPISEARTERHHDRLNKTKAGTVA